MAARAKKKEKNCPAFIGQTAGGISMNFTGLITTIPSCPYRWHILLHCTKCPPELSIEKSSPAFTGQTAGGISTKLHRSDQYHPKLCISPACSVSLNKMAARAVNRKFFSSFNRSN
jgi:hypothetical protein